MGEAPAPAPQTPEKDDAPAPPTYERVRGAADVDSPTLTPGGDDARRRPPTPPEDETTR